MVSEFFYEVQNGNDDCRNNWVGGSGIHLLAWLQIDAK